MRQRTTGLRLIDMNVRGSFAEETLGWAGKSLCLTSHLHQIMVRVSASHAPSNPVH